MSVALNRDAGAVDVADAQSSSSSPCPPDMSYVDTLYCPQLGRECIEEEYEKANNLKICHKFREFQKCAVPLERRQFCIDKYEYPNKKGAHPVWNASWFEAQATCKSKGKRLCWQSEWTAACEGKKQTPFPYGFSRDHKKCNIDNAWIEPKMGPQGFLFLSQEPEVRFAELSRLDMSVPSGSMPECKSDFDVYDQTGNFDEWTTNDEKPEEKSQWAALKGGAWGHVRNACRPASHNHFPQENYYFWSFRCCNDAPGAPVWKPSRFAQHQKAPNVEAHDFFPDPIVPRDAPGPSELRYNGVTGRYE
jgi:formylglycine-generating enzyme